MKGIYAQMDFATRDSYRHVVEKIAKHSLKSEQEVASIAINLARASFEKNSNAEFTVTCGLLFIGKGL